MSITVDFAAARAYQSRVWAASLANENWANVAVLMEPGDLVFVGTEPKAKMLQAEIAKLGGRSTRTGEGTQWKVYRLREREKVAAE
jgi:hypothetical protein